MIGPNSEVRLTILGGAYPIWGDPARVVYVESSWTGTVVTVESGVHCAVDFRQHCPFVVVVPLIDLTPAEPTDADFPT
jgi:hypothetical protein